MNPKKIYTTFYDVPFQQTNTASMKPGFRFSHTELAHILISMLVLTLAFAFALAPRPPFSHLTHVLYNLPLSFLAIATAFFCHELAHKYMGIKYGYWSEYRMDSKWLLFALFFAIAFGFLFAAPGAVLIFGNPTKEESGKMAAAGPVTNLVIASISLVVLMLSTGILSRIALFLLIINSILALFNLLPIGPFDGRKIIKWNPLLWGLLLAVGILFFVLSYTPLIF